MENHGESQNRGLRIVVLTLVRIGRWLYGALFWLALALQVFSSVRTWRYTVTYDYLCGNPLMSDWALWFVISLVVGAVVLPGGVWSIRHREERAAILFIIGFSSYALSVAFMLIAGAMFGTVPDFINFIGYAFW